MGRIASNAATLLMGKNMPSFRRHIAPEVKVRVENVGRLAISPKKMKSEIHMTFSGYPSGQKTATWAKVVERKGYAELLRHAVYGMLPKNKLRDRMIKNLIID